MRIQELRVGDIVQEAHCKFPMRVVSISEENYVVTVPYIDGYDGDVWEYDVKDLEFVEPRYTLPEWSEVEGCRDFMSCRAENKMFAIDYIISIQGENVLLSVRRCFEYTSTRPMLIAFSTIEEAKEYAQRDYNKVMTSLRKVV